MKFYYFDSRLACLQMIAAFRDNKLDEVMEIQFTHFYEWLDFIRVLFFTVLKKAECLLFRKGSCGSVKGILRNF